MTEKNPKGAGRKKGNKFSKYYWADAQTHETLTVIAVGRKSNTITNEKLNKILSQLKN